MAVEAQLEPSVLTSAAGEDSMSSGSLDVTSSSADSSSDEGPPLSPPAQYEVHAHPRHAMCACLHAFGMLNHPSSINLKVYRAEKAERHMRQQMRNSSSESVSLRNVLACSRQSGTPQRLRSRPSPGAARAAAEETAARVPAHQADSQWTTFSAFSPNGGSRKSLQHDRLQVSMLLYLPIMSTNTG